MVSGGGNGGAAAVAMAMVVTLSPRSKANLGGREIDVCPHLSVIIVNPQQNGWWPITHPGREVDVVFGADTRQVVVHRRHHIFALNQRDRFVFRGERAYVH